MFKLEKVAVFGLVLLVLLASGCGQTASTSSSLTSLQSIAFYNNASQVTPVFIPSARITAAGAWPSGTTTLYKVFYALREYVHAQDSGAIDRANLYRLLYDVDSLFGSMTTEVVALSSPKVINPPFNFGNNISYEAAINNTVTERGAAMVTSGNITKGIVTWIWYDAASTSHKEYGILEATFNALTKDLTVDFIFCVDYNSADTLCDYNNRTHISGNTATHAFEFIQTIGGSTSSAALTQIVGKGVSRGTGENFLLKVKSNHNDGFSSPLYLVVSSEANEDTLKNFNVSAEAYTSTAGLPAAVASYKNFVQNTSFYEFTDLLVDVANLNSGNPKQGTIYLNY